MSKRTWTILLAIALIGCFFLPYFNSGGVEISGYDAVFKTPGGKGAWEKYVWLLIPLSAVILLIGALNNGQYFLGRSFWAWLPLLTVIFIAVRLYMNADAVDVAPTLKQLAKFMGLGYWITLGVSVLLAFVNPKK